LSIENKEVGRAFEARPAGVGLCICWLGLALVLSGCASEPVYHRLWRGMMAPQVKQPEFISGLNQIFLPQTVEAGRAAEVAQGAQGRGEGRLLAYQPVVTAEALPQFPDDIALVTYKSKRDYDGLVQDAASDRYRELHWQYYDYEASRSIAVVPFRGVVKVGDVYDLYPRFSEWRSGFSALFVQRRRLNLATSADPEPYRAEVEFYLKSSLKQDLEMNIQGHVVAVDPDYWIEYLSWQSADQRRRGLEELKKRDKSMKFSIYSFDVELANSFLKKTGSLKPGSGLNIQW